MTSEGLWARIREKMPDAGAPFLETPDGRRLAYGDLLALTGRQAHALRRLGVEPGDRVSVQVEKSVEALALYLACQRAGAAFQPLNTAYTPAEIGYFLGDAEPRLFVCDPARRPEMEQVARKAGVPGITTLDPSGQGEFSEASAGEGEEFEDVARTGDDLAAILYTSGTTGRSKGAMLTQTNLASNAQALVETWRFTREDVLLHALPIFHTHGLFTATNTILFAGASMLYLARFDADEVIRLLPRASTMMGVPTFYTRLLAREDFDRDLVAHMRLFVSGSAPLSPEVHKAFSERTGHAILERYGMTETSMLTSNPYDGERRAGTVGFPLPGVSVRVADPESGRVLDQGDVGVIEVKGPNVFKGYWRMPEKTAEEFRSDGYFITGDMGRIDERGYLAIVGRAKDLIISGGFNVYPAEVEAAIDAIPGVAESAVIGLPHPDFGEGVAAVIARRDGASLDEEAVKAALANDLAKFKMPKRVFFVESLPRNTMGKVQKNALRETYGGVFASAGAPAGAKAGRKT
jgi:malonyl-CoA/methylmalonyl-CoA synthetase